MVTLSPKVDDATAATWTAALEPVLLEGEVVRALARSRSLLVRDGIAFTNARIFTFYSGSSEGRRVVDWIGNDKIRDLVAIPKMFRHFLQVDGEDHVMPLGIVARSEISFVEEQVQAAQQIGIEPAASEAMELLELEKAIEKLEREELLEARKQVPVVGDPLKASQWESIHSCARGNELPWLVLSSDGAGAIAAFEDRLVILKSGGMLASVASGSIALGGSASIRYDEIIAIQHIGKQLNGTLEVVTPTHPSLTTSLEEGKKIDDERWKRSNCLPIPKLVYTAWTPHIHEIGRKVAAAKR